MTYEDHAYPKGQEDANARGNQGNHSFRVPPRDVLYGYVNALWKTKTLIRLDRRLNTSCKDISEIII